MVQHSSWDVITALWGRDHYLDFTDESKLHRNKMKCPGPLGWKAMEVEVELSWPKGEEDESPCLLVSTHRLPARSSADWVGRWPLNVSSFLLTSFALAYIFSQTLLSSLLPNHSLLPSLPLSPSSTLRTRLAFSCPFSSLTSEKRLAVWLRVGPLSFPGSIFAFQGDQCGCHQAQISGRAKFLLKMPECENHVHRNTETVSTSYRSSEKKSYLTEQLTSKIPFGNPPSTLLLFHKRVSRGV